MAATAKSFSEMRTPPCSGRSLRVATRSASRRSASGPELVLEHVGPWEGLRVVVPLHLLAAQQMKHLRLLARLHAFGDDDHLERVRKRNDRRDDRHALL